MGDTVWDGQNYTLFDTTVISNYQPGEQWSIENEHVRLTCALHRMLS